MGGLPGPLVHKQTGIPVIYTEHNKQERYHRITFRLNKLTFNWQNLAIAVSDDVKTSIEKNIHPSIPVQTVLNGVNTTSFQRDVVSGSKLKKELGIAEESIVIGTVAVFRFQKRLVEWLQVFHTIHQKYPDVRGIIAGDGPLKEEILAERKRLGLEEAVLMPGLQTEIRPYLSAMDIYMMTSSFEGLPIALLEAMSMECAIISTTAGGIGEVIRDEKEGLLTGVDQWPELADHAERLVLDPGLRSELGTSGRKRIMDAFSMDRMVRELEAIYRQFASKA